MPIARQKNNVQITMYSVQIKAKKQSKGSLFPALRAFLAQICPQKFKKKRVKKQWTVVSGQWLV
ncbi:MAG: hypothetical protein FWG09_05350, partial [Synergistaceae bacterium]|nr:hypothetical protein [Synergistaceae bacterium]